MNLLTTKSFNGVQLDCYRADNADDCFWANMSTAEHVRFYTELGHPKMEAIKLVAKDRRVGKNRIYKELLETGGEE